MYDCVFVGGGIIGLATAYVFGRQFPDKKILILEKESHIASHQTGHNSGVIHSGIYYKPQSAKLQNCLKGYDLLLDFAKENDIPYHLCGKLIAAVDASEMPMLKNIYQNAQKNGLQNILYLKESQQIRQYEPYCAALQAIWVPQTGIIDYKKVSEVLLEKIKNQTGEIQTSCKVIGIQKSNNAHILKTTKGDFITQQIVNCAGLFSDAVWNFTQKTHQENFQIVPFRGEYYHLKPSKNYLVKNLIYPIPDANFPFLGVHLTKMISGQIKVGPNAVLAFSKEGYHKYYVDFKELYRIFSHKGFQKIMKKYWKAGLGELYRSFSKTAFTKSLQKLIPEIKKQDLQTAASGVRAQMFDNQGLVDDFIIKKQKGMIHVLNAPSPAATSCFSIAHQIIQKIKTK